MKTAGKQETGMDIMRTARHTSASSIGATGWFMGCRKQKNGGRYVYDHLSQYAVPEIGMPEFNKYLERSMQRPTSTETRTGTVKVVFNVGNDGSVWDFVILQGLSQAYDQEAIRLIKQGPAWRPGVLHGHEKIPSQGYVEVVF